LELPPTLLASVHAKPKRHTVKFLDARKRQATITGLANGESKRAIARKLGVSPNTVTAVAEQEWQQVAARKQRLAAQYERIADGADDRILEQLDSDREIPLNVLVPVSAMATDKFTLLRGDAVIAIRHEHLHRVNADDIIAFAAQCALNAKAAKATVVETPQLPEKREIRLQAKKRQRKKQLTNS
jgi:hypothetical protein